MTARLASPLRYPGGKTCLYPIASQILRINGLERGHYAEPYAGGAGLALALLFNGQVGEIHLNDIDRSIWTFWDAVLNSSAELIELIRGTPVTIEEWHRHRAVYLAQDGHSDLELAFATFFLNRTNRSGVIKGGGVIGGLDQSGPYKLDCRFNRDDLAQRIGRIAKYRSRINLYRSDAIDFLAEMDRSLPDRSFLCIDPPYFNKGSALYTSFYKPADHHAVSQSILGLTKPWILTYDNTPEISHLYTRRRQFGFDVNYSLQTKRVGTELLIVSRGLALPQEIKDRVILHPHRQTA